MYPRSDPLIKFILPPTDRISGAAADYRPAHQQLSPKLGGITGTSLAWYIVRLCTFVAVTIQKKMTPASSAEGCAEQAVSTSCTTRHMQPATSQGAVADTTEVSLAD